MRLAESLRSLSWGGGMLRRLLQPPARLGLSTLASPLLVSRALIRPAVATRTLMSVAIHRSPLWAAPALGSLARGAPLAPRIATRSMTAHTMGAPRKKRRVDKPRKQKLKSHHGARKRFKMRDDGRWVHWRIGRQHLVTGTSANVRRAKRKPKLVMGNRWQRKLRMLMPYGCRFTRRRVVVPGPKPPKTGHAAETGRVPRLPKPPKLVALSENPMRYPGFAPQRTGGAGARSQQY